MSGRLVNGAVYQPNVSLTIQKKAKHSAAPFSNRHRICFQVQAFDEHLAEMTAIQTILLMLATGCAADSCAATCEQHEMEFGRAVFEAKTLSSDSKTSCATCHDPTHDFATGLRVATGVGGTSGTRNAPSLLNVGDDTSFFWDGRRSSLDESVLDAFTNPVELGLSSNEELVQKVKLANLLQDRLPVTLASISKSLSCYLRSLNTHASRYDQYLAGNKRLNDRELEGLKLFRDIAGCASCHRMDT